MHKTKNNRKRIVPGRLSLCVLALTAGITLPGVAQAFHLPLWEMGAGLGVVNVPHYRGSEIETDMTLPFPYIIYRGDVLRVDREDGIRGKLFQSPDLSLDLSMAGNIPVSDTDEGARSDMPGLDPLIEAGAELTVNLWRSLTVNLWRSESNSQRFQFVAPYRFVYSVGDPILKYQGWTFSPYLNYRIHQRGSKSLTRYNISFGPIYGDSRYHDYFYEVRPEFVTVERPAYEADRGYSGSRITVTVSRNTKKYMLGAFARYDNLDGAVFDDSPLVETTDYFAVGFAFGWIFGSSDTTVPHESLGH
jgi:outer membrane scaffolding protein for murein synthesis (MipA/OmpV family)